MTRASPPTPFIDRLVLPSADGRNSATAVEICGVYPTNQAERLLSVVPVLPATGRPTAWAFVPVPKESVTTCCMASVTCVAMSASNTRAGCGVCW